MKYPEIFLLPVLMLADYFLTVVGRIQSEKEYSKHFKMEHYELNPIWQKSIAGGKWFNIRHIFLVILGTLFSSILFEFGDLPYSYIQGFMGALFTVYSVIVARHLSNLLIFQHSIRNPDEMSGQVNMSYSMTLSISAYQCLAALFPMGIIVFFSPTPFVIGALIGLAVLFAAHFGWLRQYKKRLKS